MGRLYTVAFEAAWVLAALVQPNRILSLCSGASLVCCLHAFSIPLGIIHLPALGKEGVNLPTFFKYLWEPPSAQGHAGWCGGWRLDTSGYPIMPILTSVQPCHRKPYHMYHDLNVELKGCSTNFYASYTNF